MLTFFSSILFLGRSHVFNCIFDLAMILVVGYFLLNIMPQTDGVSPYDKVKNGIYFALDRIGSENRKTYFFKGEGGIFVRAGCLFSDMDAFKERVKDVHKNTMHERHYLAACDLAEMILKDKWEERNKNAG